MKPFWILAFLALVVCPVAAHAAPGEPTVQKIEQAKRLITASIANDPYRIPPFEAVDWSRAHFSWIDLNGDNHKEAIVTVWMRSECGYISCPIYIVTWRENKAAIVSILSDGYVESIRTATKGWQDLKGFYYDYRWNGSDYDRICKTVPTCDDG